MHPFMIGMLGFVIFFVFVIIPFLVFFNLYKTRQKGDGTWARLIIVDRSGVQFADDVFPKDREVVHAWRHNEKGDKVEFDYRLIKGLCGPSMWPPYRGKFWQVSIISEVVVDGVSTPPEIVGDIREGGSLKPFDSARAAAMQRLEKGMHVAMQDAEAMEEAGAGEKKGASTLLIVIGFVVILIALIAVTMMMNSKLSGISGQLKDLIEALVGKTP